MQCPVDGETLVMADRSGVEIDYCPKCRGVWLDRGELDKILEKSTAAARPVYQPEPERREAEREGRDRYDGDDRDGRYRGKRREGFLSELFDF